MRKDKRRQSALGTTGADPQGLQEWHGARSTLEDFQKAWNQMTGPIMCANLLHHGKIGSAHCLIELASQPGSPLACGS